MDPLQRERLREIAQNLSGTSQSIPPYNSTYSNSTYDLKPELTEWQRSMEFRVSQIEKTIDKAAELVGEYIGNVPRSPSQNSYKTVNSRESNLGTNLEYYSSSPNRRNLTVPFNQSQRQSPFGAESYLRDKRRPMLCSPESAFRSGSVPAGRCGCSPSRSPNGRQSTYCKGTYSVNNGR